MKKEIKNPTSAEPNVNLRRRQDTGSRYTLTRYYAEIKYFSYKRCNLILFLFV